MSEDRGALYKIRWEILVMAVSLILSAVVVLAIPYDFGDRLIKQQREQKEMEKKLEIEERLGFKETTSNSSAVMNP